jgi:uncharacterized protein
MTDFFTVKKDIRDHWYKEPWMLLVLGGPAIVVVAALFTFYIAWQGEDNVISKDYYRQGVNINKDIDLDKKSIEYNVLANAKVDSSGTIQLQLEGKINFPATIQMELSSYSPGSEYEAMQKSTLTQIKPGRFEGAVKIPSPSESANLKLWHVKIIGPDWRLTADWHDPLHSSLQLKPQN